MSHTEKDVLSTVIEACLKAHVGNVWDESYVTSLMGEARFTRDTEAINESARQPIEDFVMRGGKRLRPRLFLSLTALFGLPYERYIDFAYFTELIHNGTLMIDDVEDSSELRRGKPTAHLQFGIDVAVNAGMLMQILPLAVLIKNTAKLSHEQEFRIWRIYGEEMVNVYMGQTIDINWHGSALRDISEEQYLEMCRLKTGALMRMSVRIPCALADTNESVEESYSRFAENLGIVFQIRDDVLDLTADTQEFGKSFGNDITEGKLSLPVILALRTLSSLQGGVLREILKSHTRDTALILKAITLIKESGALQKADAIAQDLFVKGWEGIVHDVSPRDTIGAFENFVKGFIIRTY